MSVSAWNDQHTPLASIGYKYNSGAGSGIIYTVILSATIIALILLPFIPIQISINSQGVIQSSLERIELFSSVSGRIVEVRMKENQSISAGDTVLVIDSSLPGQQRKILSRRSELLSQLLEDVGRIVNHASPPDKSTAEPVFLTEQYRASWLQFRQEFEERLLNRDQAERIFRRYNTLYEKGAITLSESEKLRYEYDKAISDQTLLINRWRSQWEMEAGGYRRELSELLSREAEIEEQNKLFTLRTPANGSVQSLVGMQAGSYVFANQKIAEISPNAQLIALCYVKPTDIGLIRKGQLVNFQVDAFNYNQWGLISGKVIDISDDIIFSDQGVAVFKVRCVLESDYLKLKNEYKGYLKKGMSFTARFMVSERTLFQLLYDKLDDWLNPNFSAASPEI
ncbi:HlyD family secretion protein [Daejeonella sp.]|uniref:HlyD family secretion protein n=1 Tax=Daejeonella sp. TaxID=2805397 RepID=UPI002731CB02|nr:HlyD family efflux transporter periplasmic adaptor subunit [Daejeonella sp.]MDP2412366.1 HlyD family efflux transporter periplasmic adaptor subunit [Daejeonella sp.]